MPSASTLSKVPRWALPVVCGLAGAAISLPFWQHLWNLCSHLASGSWEIVSDNIAVEKAIKLKYGADRAGIAVHRVAGSGLLLPLTEDYRGATIDRVARITLAEQPSLRFNGTPLESTYDELLRSLEGIAENSPASLLPGTTEMIAKARSDYDDAKADRGLDFPPFGATTNPDYDEEGTWTRHALRLEQNGRCSGTVSQLGSTGEVVTADIRTFPTALEVEIERPWISTLLLDRAAQLPIPEVQKFFSADRVEGGLRLIPQTMWILQTDAIEVNVNGDAKSKITNWVNDNTCCKITCLDRSFTLEPGTVRWKDKTAFGLLTSPKLQLFALISKRRGT